jgi:hypothetical protein
MTGYALAAATGGLRAYETGPLDMLERGTDWVISRPQLGEPSRGVRATLAVAEPRWLGPTAKRLPELLALAHNWDKQGGKPIRIDIVMFAMTFLARMALPEMPAPQIVPLSDGGLQMEWHLKDLDVEVAFIQPNLVDVSFEDLRRIEPNWDARLSSDFSALQTPFRLLAVR